MREYRVVHVAVFTEEMFAGNPLAVVLDATGLAEAELPAIGRGLIPGLPGTTFVLPPEAPGADARVRIFSGAVEIPFSGHSTLGTAHVLATGPRRGQSRLVLEEGIGLVEVTIEGAGAPALLWLRHGATTLGAEGRDRAGIARALGLTEADLAPDLPIQAAVGGLEFLYVPVRDRAAVDRVALDVPALLDAEPAAAALGVFVFAPEADPAAPRVYARMLAPHTLGLGEDPGTGSASGPLAAYLVRHGIVRREGEVRLVSEQGTRMGRQSFAHIAFRAEGGVAHGIRVGGHVTPVLDGVLRLP